MARLELTLLGGFEGRLDSGAPLPPLSRKVQALLAYLCLSAGHSHPRDKLAALLWGGLNESKSRGSLRQALTALRRALAGTGALRLEADTVAVDAAALAVDVTALEAHVAEDSDAALAAAADLYRGDLLAGLGVQEAQFHEWLLSERERLRELALSALGRLLARQRAAGDREAAVQTALKLVALDPLQEAVHRTLMHLYAQLGHRSAALRQYQLCVTALERELRAEPEADTRALYQQILRERPADREPVAPATIASAPPGIQSTGTAPGETPLVGREREIERLRQAIATARQGQGRLVALIGESGVGKSRLATEALAEAARAGACVLVGRCYETEQMLPLAPWIEAFRTARVAMDRALLDGLAPVWRSQLARLLPEMETAAAGTRIDTDPLHVFEALAQLLERLGESRLVVVAIEDCHWADDPSLRLIAFLGRRLEARPVLFVATVREETLDTRPALRQVGDELRAAGRLDEVVLRPLSRGDTGQLAAQLAGPGVPPDTLAAMQAEVWRASEGNPFVVVETLRALRDRPRHERGAPVVRRVQQLIAGRLDQLGEGGRVLVAVAATIGRQFDFGLLCRAAGLSEEATADGVEELVRHRVLQEAADGLEFTHDRIREVAYAALLPARRVLLHRAVAEALEVLAARERGRSALAIGTHAFSGEAWDKAVRHLGQAGLEASAKGASPEALTCHRQALLALSHLPDGPATRGQRFDLVLSAWHDLYRLGRFDEALEHCREAEGLARALEDRHRLGQATITLSYTLGTVARYAEGIEAGERALALADASGDLSLHVWARIILGRLYLAVGRHGEAIDCGRWVLRELQTVPVTERLMPVPLFPAVRARVWLALTLAATGELDEALDLAEQAVSLAERVDNRAERAWALYSLGRVRMVRGEFHRGAAALEGTLALYEATPVASAVPRTLAALALARAHLGQPQEAVPLIERALDEASTSHARYGQSMIFVHAGIAHLLAGRADEAAQAAREAIRLTRERGERGDEAWALLVAADARAARAQADDAEAARGYGEALALAIALGMRPLQARCHLALAGLHRAAGRAEEMRAAAERAAELYGALGVGFWRDRALALAAAPA